MFSIRLVLGYISLLWYIFILTAAYIGFFEIMTKYRKRKYLENPNLIKDWEGVTIIRPIKGIDPELSSCLKSSFDQDYPADKLQILFCVDDPHDLAIPTIENLIINNPHIDAKIILSDNYNPITRKSSDHYGPNPKVNNLAKGFTNAKYDILWIMDSNVWASSNILKNSIKTLLENLNNGERLNNPKKPVKLVHHVPLALSFSNRVSSTSDLEYSLSPRQSNDGRSKSPRFLKKLGSKLDEMFLLTSHSKFYIALNKLSIGACVNGKSNIYRRSDLDKSVELIKDRKSPFFTDDKVIRDSIEILNKGLGRSIEFFSRYIGEDNMIAISLWDNLNSRTGQTTDVVIQPLSGIDNSVKDYVNRRVRWLRVRKYMVILATLIEPTTESIICGLIGNFAIATLFTNEWFLPWLFCLHMFIWVVTDYIQYYTLVDNITNQDNCINQPNWLKDFPSSQQNLFKWFYIWILREILALPIWISAMIGHEIDWRGRPFRIKHDLTAEEL